MNRRLDRRAVLAGVGTLALAGVTTGQEGHTTTPDIGTGSYDIDWQQGYPASSNITEVTELSRDGEGVLLVGTAGGPTDPRLALLRTDGEGAVDWRRTYTTSPRVSPANAIRLADGSTVVGGPHASSTNGVVLRIGPEGDRQFAQRLDITAYGLSPVVRLGDDTYGMLGFESSDNETPVLATIGLDGTPGPTYQVAVEAPGAYFHAAKPLADGGCIAAGITRETDDDPGRVVVAKLRQDATVDWETTVDVEAHPHVHALVLTPNAVVLGGVSYDRSLGDGLAETAFLASVSREGVEQSHRRVARSEWAVHDLATVDGDQVVGVGQAGLTAQSRPRPWLFRLSETGDVDGSASPQIQGVPTALHADQSTLLVGGRFGDDGEDNPFLASVTQDETSTTLPGFTGLTAGAGVLTAAGLTWYRARRDRTTK